MSFLTLSVLAVDNLWKNISSLDAKMAEMENLTSQLSPMSNITENIKKIKELIEQARDAANRVNIPLSSQVHYKQSCPLFLHQSV